MLGKLYTVYHVSSAVLICSPFGWRYSGDIFQGYGNWDGNTVLGLCSQQCHQTQEKVSKHQLAAKGKCTDCTGKEIPQKNCCPRLERAKQRRSSQKSSPACCFLVLIESRSLSEAPNTGCGYQGRLSDLILLTVWSHWCIMALALVKSLTQPLHEHLPQITHPGSVLCDLLPFPFSNSVVLNTRNWFCWSLFS